MCVTMDIGGGSSNIAAAPRVLVKAKHKEREDLQLGINRRINNRKVYAV